MKNKTRVCTVFGNDSELSQVKSVLLKLGYEEYSTVKPSNFDDRDNCIVCEVYGEENTKMFYFTKLNSNNVPQIPFVRFMELCGRKQPVYVPKEWLLDLRIYTISLNVVIGMLYSTFFGQETLHRLKSFYGSGSVYLILVSFTIIVSLIVLLLIPKNKKL